MNFKELARNSGDLFLPTPVRRFLYQNIIGSNDTLFYISYWSIIHFISGIATFFILPATYTPRQMVWAGMVIHTIWELWQKFIGMTIWDLRGAIDTIMDSLLFGIGLVITIYWRRL